MGGMMKHERILAQILKRGHSHEPEPGALEVTLKEELCGGRETEPMIGRDVYISMFSLPEIGFTVKRED
ncbi:hypothetical protein CPC08DRAFT_716123 [Agrocybe pediades]|nr:hypothetical protein CPC08DRAFT_716123 [Agrocybe pediades]